MSNSETIVIKTLHVEYVGKQNRSYTTTQFDNKVSLVPTPVNREYTVPGPFAYVYNYISYEMKSKTELITSTKQVNYDTAAYYIIRGTTDTDYEWTMEINTETYLLIAPYLRVGIQLPVATRWEYGNSSP